MFWHIFYLPRAHLNYCVPSLRYLRPLDVHQRKVTWFQCHLNTVKGYIIYHSTSFLFNYFSSFWTKVYFYIRSALAICKEAYQFKWSGSSPWELWKAINGYDLVLHTQHSESVRCWTLLTVELFMICFYYWIGSDYVLRTTMNANWHHFIWSKFVLQPKSFN